MNKFKNLLLILLAVASLIGSFGCGSGDLNPAAPSTGGLTEAERVVDLVRTGDNFMCQLFMFHCFGQD